MKHLLPIICLLACACASKASTTEPVGDCEPRVGVYLVTYTETNGNCGELADEVVEIRSMPTEPDPPCAGSIRYSEDLCRVQQVMVCTPELLRAPPIPVTDAGQTVGYIDGGYYPPGRVAFGAQYTDEQAEQIWSRDGQSATARYRLIRKIADASGQDQIVCASSYDVVMTEI